MYDSIEQLLVGLDSKSEFATGDSRSGASLQRVSIGGTSYVLKLIAPADDWLMRISGDDHCWNLRAWESGIMNAVPDFIDHATVGAFRSETPDGIQIGFLMRDARDSIVPDGDGKLTQAQEIRFLDAMAELHASFWKWEDSVGLVPIPSRYLFFTPEAAHAEIGRGTDSPIPALMIRGWQELEEIASEASAIIRQIHREPGEFVKAITGTPQTLLHGDWKATNLGIGSDGRVILLDWAFPGSGPACSDLTWYLAINAARIPGEREESVAIYREALERHGIATGAWWEYQLSLALLGTMLQFGWEKALGGRSELDWWLDKITTATQFLEK